MKAWRFIPFSLNPGWLNMAIDEAILEEHLQGTCPPTLRLYGFSPYTVSLGYAQKISKDSVQKIEGQGVSVVRRPTGGRGVLHVNDLTYSFVALANDAELPSPQEDSPRILAPSVQGAYKQISAGLMMALSRFGIETELGKSAADYRLVEDCFAQTTQADLHYQGKKLVGSAQLRRKGAVLQHGSILLKRADLSLAELLGKETRRIQNPDDETDGAVGSLEDILGRALDKAELNSAFKAGFEEAFEQRFEEGKLSEAEEARAKSLGEKYKEIFPD